jgi:hypothetical protein
MMEIVPKNVWRRERATLLPGTSPGSAMIAGKTKGEMTSILAVPFFSSGGIKWDSMKIQS